MRRIVLAAALALTAFPSAAPASPPAPEADWSACAAVAVDPGTVRQALGSFDVVFGKPALEWRDRDYRQLMELAIACDGTSVDGQVIDARAWHDAVEAAKEDVFELAGIHQEIMGKGKDLLTGRVPLCTELMAWKADKWAMQDNSAELFGTSFLAMPPDELRGAIQHINNCLGFLPEYLRQTRSEREKDTKDFVYAIMDTALLVEKRQKDWRFWRGKRSTDVTVTEDGVLIPPTFTSEKARNMVVRFNRAASFKGGFSLDTVSALISIADEVIEANASRVDILYAEEVKRLVQEDIFNRTEYKLN